MPFKPVVLNIQSGTHVARALRSGELGSGSITGEQVASGAIQSGALGQDAILSGNLASGSVRGRYIASGTVTQEKLDPSISIDIAETLREPQELFAAETISGGFSVALDSSGRGIVALATAPATSGRMPAIGVEASGAASGALLTVQLDGRMFSPQFSFSGSLGSKLFVGASGELATTPPSAEGSEQQRMGSTFNASGAILRVAADTFRIEA